MAKEEKKIDSIDNEDEVKVATIGLGAAFRRVASGFVEETSGKTSLTTKQESATSVEQEAETTKATSAKQKPVAEAEAEAEDNIIEEFIPKEDDTNSYLSWTTIDLMKELIRSDSDEAASLFEEYYELNVKYQDEIDQLMAQYAISIMKLRENIIQRLQTTETSNTPLLRNLCRVFFNPYENKYAVARADDTLVPDGCVEFLFPEDPNTGEVLLGERPTVEELENWKIQHLQK